MHFIKIKCHAKVMHTRILLSCSKGTEDVNHQQETSMDKREQALSASALGKQRNNSFFPAVYSLGMGYWCCT